MGANKLVFIFIVSLAIAACKKETPGINTPVSTDRDTTDTVNSNVNVISPETAHLENDTSKLNQGVYEFQFNGSPPSFHSGDIIIGSENGGYLRKVNAVSTAGSAVILNTSQASLEDVFKHANIHIPLQPFASTVNSNRGSSTMKDLKINSIAQGVSLAPNGDSILFTGVVLYQEGPFNYQFTGKVTFAPHYIFDIAIDNYKIDHLVFSTENTNLTMEYDFILTAAQNVSFVDHKKTLVDFEKSFLTTVAGIPIVVVVNTTLSSYLSINLGAHYLMSGGVSRRYNFTLGASYENGIWTDKYTSYTPTISTKEFIMEGGVNFKQQLLIVPEIKVRLYGIVGPYFIPSLKENFTAEISSPSLDWNAILETGVDATAGIDVSIFGKTLLDYSKTFSSSNIVWDAPHKIEIISGDNQNGNKEQALPLPLKVKVIDNYDRPFAKVPVYFSVTQGGGMADNESVMTDSNGIAECSWLLGNAAGEQKLEAHVKKADGTAIQNSPVLFSATAASTLATLEGIQTTFKGIGASDNTNRETIWDVAFLIQDSSLQITNNSKLHFDWSNGWDQGSFDWNLFPSNQVQKTFAATWDKIAFNPSYYLQEKTTLHYTVTLWINNNTVSNSDTFSLRPPFEYCETLPALLYITPTLLTKVLNTQDSTYATVWKIEGALSDPCLQIYEDSYLKFTWNNNFGSTGSFNWKLYPSTSTEKMFLNNSFAAGFSAKDVRPIDYDVTLYVKDQIKSNTFHFSIQP